MERTKRILLIEDEVHKREELSGYLREFLGDSLDLHVADNVRGAVLAVAACDYDLVVLDMALPTFTTRDGTIDGGLDQALGGVEVLRTLRSLGKKLSILIVTQYPDISLEGKRIKLKSAQSALQKKYGQDIRGAVLYQYRSATNRPKIKSIVDAIW